MRAQEKEDPGKLTRKLSLRLRQSQTDLPSPPDQEHCPKKTGALVGEKQKTPDLQKAEFLSNSQKPPQQDRYYFDDEGFISPNVKRKSSHNLSFLRIAQSKSPFFAPMSPIVSSMSTPLTSASLSNTLFTPGTHPTGGILDIMAVGMGSSLTIEEIQKSITEISHLYQQFLNVSKVSFAELKGVKAVLTEVISVFANYGLEISKICGKKKDDKETAIEDRILEVWEEIIGKKKDQGGSRIFEVWKVIITEFGKIPDAYDQFCNVIISFH